MARLASQNLGCGAFTTQDKRKWYVLAEIKRYSLLPELLLALITNLQWLEFLSQLLPGQDIYYDLAITGELVRWNRPGWCSLISLHVLMVPV